MVQNLEGGLRKIMVGGKKKKQILSRRESLRTSDSSVLSPPSGKGKGDIVWPPLDPNDPKRWALYGNKKVWPERGINMRVFGSTFIQEAVRAIDWVGFVRTPNMAALDLV